MIDYLTPEQLALMSVVANEWIERSRTWRPVNIDNVRGALPLLYSGMPAPLIIALPSPMAAQRHANVSANVDDNVSANVRANVRANVDANVDANVYANVRANVYANVYANVCANVCANVDDNVSANVDANVRANVRKNVYANVYDNVHANVRTNVDDNVDDNVSTNVRENVDANVSANVSDNVYANVSTNVDANVCANVYALPTLVCGASWYSLAARADYYSRIGLRFNDYVDVWLKFQRESGAWYLISLADRMIISEAPVLTRLDDQGRLHSETGPAIAWRDCYAQFYWHGQCVPGEWIVCAESVSAADILVESNLEKRRAGCEIIGWDRILTELGAVEIDKHADPEIGTLLDVTLPDSGTERFLRVLEAHSGRQFAYCVPREVNTAQEAQNWIWQCDPGENYQPEARA